MVNMEIGTIRKIQSCKTTAQVERVLSESGLRVVRDDSADVGCYSVWIDEYTRIYRPNKRNGFIVQGHFPVQMEYSGIPVFFL